VYSGGSSLFKNVAHTQQLQECIHEAAATIRNEMEMHEIKLDVRWSDDAKWHALETKEEISES
jgi:hypothetical protein